MKIHRPSRKHIVAIIIILIAIVIFCALGGYELFNPARYTRIRHPQDSSFSFKPFKTPSGYAILLGQDWDSIAIQHEHTLASSNYTILHTQLPVIYITTESGSMKAINASKEKDVSESGSIKVVEADGIISYRGRLDKIRGRGNYTWKFDPKRPYNITLDKSTSILGLNKGKKFSLIASYTDASQIRNFIALEAARSLNMPFAVKSAMAHVFFNGEYNGLYQVTNKLGIERSCVDIENLEEATKDVNGGNLKKCQHYKIGKDRQFDLRSGIIGNNPEDITGGYLLETYAVGTSAFHVNHSSTVTLKSPSLATQEQIDYISNRYLEMLDAIYDDNGINPNTHKHYSEYIDISSFAKYYLLQEVFLNHDGGGGSLYLFKNSDLIDSLFYAGPIWDMGSGIGNPCLNDYALIPNATYLKGRLNILDETTFLGRLYEHEEFKSFTDSLYESCVRDMIYRYSVGQEFKTFCELLKPEILANNLRWKQHSTLEEVEKDLTSISTFMQKRITFFDQIITGGALGKRITVNTGFRFILEYNLLDGENLNLPHIDRIRDNNAITGWRNTRTNLPYTQEEILLDGDTIIMDWHPKKISDIIQYYWEKRNNIISFFK